MKTINQVLLALIFVAFSTVGFAQSQTIFEPGNIEKRVVDQRYKYIEVDDEEDDDDENEDNSSIAKEEWNSINQLIPRKTNMIIYEGYYDYVPNGQ